MRTKYTRYTSILRLIAGAAAVSAAAASYAATTITDSQTVSGDGADNYIFAGGAGGESYLLQTGSVTNIRNLKKVGSAYVGTMEVNENVDAIINFTTTARGGYQSEKTAGFRFGGSIAGTVDGSATLSGAGKDVSSLSFYGYSFDTGHVVSETAATIAQDTMTISNLTVNYNGLGSNSLARIILLWKIPTSTSTAATLARLHRQRRLQIRR